MGRNNVTIRKHNNGEDVWLRCVFFDQDYAETDPNTITMTITFPDGTTSVKTKADMVHWTEPDSIVEDGHWQYQHTNDKLGFHKFHVAFVMANGDNGVSVGRWKVI